MPTPPAASRVDPRRRRLMIGLGGLAASMLLGRPLRLAVADLQPSRLRQAMQTEYGDDGLEPLDAWFALLERLAASDLDTQLREVNDFFNDRVRWLEDTDIWGEQDYWATPLETLGRGQGDCEDFCIAKYTTLLQLGVPDRQLRLIYVRARYGLSRTPQPHMVLGYYATPEAEPLILDNLNPEITLAGQRSDLVPVFSFNSEGLWEAGSSRSRADPTQRLTRWRRVLTRMAEQGFR